MKIEDKDTYSKEEVIEIVRQVLYGGTPDLYDKGGVLGTINTDPNGTTKKAINYFEKYCLKNKLPNQE